MTNDILQKIAIKPWLIDALVIILTAYIINVIFKISYRHLRKITKNTKNFWDNSVAEASYAPIVATIWLVATKFTIDKISFSMNQAVISWTTLVLKVLTTLIIAWFLIRLADIFCRNFIKDRKKREIETDETTVGAVLKLIKLIIMIFTALTCLQNLGVSISGFLAAGGVGGLVVGFAAKDLLANFFGGLTIYMDKPFKVDDWIRCNEINVEGIVEYIGWRHTRIRAFNKNPIYIPNATFTTVVVENPSRMSHRRIKETIGIRYCDISKMQVITDDIKKMFSEHPEVDPDSNPMAYFVSFGPSSVDFVVNALILNTQWQHFCDVKHEILLKISDIIEGHGAEIAFPTRTIYVENEG